MPNFLRTILIFITGYAWLLLLAGPGLMGLGFYSNWKAEGEHAYTPRAQLTSITGNVTQASEVTVKKKRRATKKYYELNVQTSPDAQDTKLRIDFSTPENVVSGLVDEKITALYDSADHHIVYDVQVGDTNVIGFDETRDRLKKEAAESAATFSGVGVWIAAVLMTLLGGFGVWFHRRLRATA